MRLDTGRIASSRGTPCCVPLPSTRFGLSGSGGERGGRKLAGESSFAVLPDRHVPVRVQNRLLARLAPERKDIIYR